jgi:hypothetical protein
MIPSFTPTNTTMAVVSASRSAARARLTQQQRPYSSTPSSLLRATASEREPTSSLR